MVPVGVVAYKMSDHRNSNFWAIAWFDFRGIVHAQDHRCKSILSISLHAIRYINLWHYLSIHYDLLLEFWQSPDCHPAVCLSSSTILLHVVFGLPGLLLEHGSNIPVSCPGFELQIHDRSCRLLGFLSAVTQMHHPATVGPCRFTDVDRDLNVFHFCNSLIFTGVGYQPPAQPTTWRTRGITLRLASTLWPVLHGWPYQEYEISADIALGVIETRKPSHHNKVTTP